MPDETTQNAATVRESLNAALRRELYEAACDPERDRWSYPVIVRPEDVTRGSRWRLRWPGGTDEIVTVTNTEAKDGYGKWYGGFGVRFDYGTVLSFGLFGRVARERVA